MNKDEIIKNSRPLIINSINKYARSKGDFDDLYQDGVIHILESLESYDASLGITVFAYIKSRLKFFYLNYGRYDRTVYSLNEAVDEEGHEIIDALIDDSADTEALIIEKEEYSRMDKALDGLEKNEKSLLNRIFRDGHTLKAIALDLNISLIAVFRKKEKILKKVRKLYEKS